MYDCKKLLINGEWIATQGRALDIINPATEEVIGQVALGTAEDVDKAVKAARRAFETYSQTSVEERAALLERIIGIYQKRMPELGKAISDEMGAPLKFAIHVQAGVGLGHFATALALLKGFEFEKKIGTTMLRREPVGVCGLITPWNWPANQICCKIAPALAVGCTIVLKPSETAPISAQIIAEILVEAGVPQGVFNLVQGDGAGVGSAISAHPDIDMVSFTGSTRAGVLVAKAAADSVKRVSQELGGKSANIILEDADHQQAVAGGVIAMMSNTGQSCNAPSRMLVHESRYEEALKIAKAAAESVKVGDPNEAGTGIGPLSNGTQFKKVQGLIEKGIEEGARVVVGGPGRPEGLTKGYYTRPTVFANVNNSMTIAREEIFGPVLVMIPYKNDEDAIRIANDTPYGLSGYVSSGDPQRAKRVASRLRTGMVHINGAQIDLLAPFGGYKQSGNGREWGGEGFEEFVERKAVMGGA
ncbi:MAG TPA: aldehyde dehydrogenase family protein [Polyangiales bacterium]|jgi:aldehyde dehydrogenase (NAD+)|nr:aldehyde dehydrogenase family protein [Polyangiales bacterium]